MQDWDARGLSVRARRALRREGVDTLEQLAALAAEDVLCWKDVGRTTAEEFRRLLAAHGLCFADERPGADAPFGCHVVRRVRVERLTLSGPAAEGKAVMESLFDAGFRLVRSGPYTDKDMWPEVDVTRFLFEAEKEVACPT